MKVFPILTGILVALLGIVFFFTIIGVFGLWASIGSLIAFVALALWVFRRTGEGAR